ncbi:MAG: sigma-70 family RNA polymerase sigma factor [Chitinophagaceae bacterium]|nr:sigma-70 family RNA polymerase sigma factor [Chitinophagaceae bacterium]
MDNSSHDYFRKEIIEIYDERLVHMISIAKRYTGSLDEAKDIVGDIFAKALKRKKPFESKSKAISYFNVSLRNSLINHGKKNKTKKEYRNYLIAQLETEAAFIQEGVSMDQIIDHTMSKLTEDEQTLLLSCHKKKNTSEIAAKLGVTKNTAYNKRHKVKQKALEIFRQLYKNLHVFAFAAIMQLTAELSS